MYQRILVPMDGSPLAEQALPYVRILARELKCPVELMRVFDPVPEQLADPAHGLYIDQLASSFREQAEHSLHAYVGTLQDLGFEVSTSAHEGHAATEIVENARRGPETLIAMSTHGRSGVSRWVLGSVTDKVLHATGSTLLMLRARPESTFTPGTVSTQTERWPTTVGIDTVVLPLDGSQIAEQAVPHATALAKALQLNVQLVRVAESAAARGEAGNYLSQMGEKMRQDGLSEVQERVLEGDPATVIVDMTHESSKNLLAMTTHGRSGIGRWVLGSVTDRVVRYSGAPVLVTRAT